MTTELLSGLKYLWKQAFADSDEAIDLFFQTGFSPSRCNYTLRNGQVICALYWFDCTWNGKKLAYIYALATLPSHRKQGLAAALLTDTHRVLQEQGYHGAVLKPAEGLFPFYQRQGYSTSGYVSRFSAEAGSYPVPLKELGLTEYAAARRIFLPENSVLLEGDALAFLHTYARFFLGPNCLIACSREHPDIYEFLGDRTAVPGVLKSLKIPQADMLTPGRDVPFVMYHSFVVKSEKGPTYLGISLE